MRPEQIRRLRQRLGLSQRQLAQVMGVSQQVVSFWERGERKPRRVHRDYLRQLQRRLEEAEDERRQKERLQELITAGLWGAGLLLVFYGLSSLSEQTDPDDE